MPARSSIALQFRSESYDFPSGYVDGGTVMTWIDKAAYACAASWSGTNVVASYVGHMDFAHPVPVETRAVVQARMVYTGNTSVHVQTRVVLRDLKDDDGASVVCTECLMVYVSVDEDGRSIPVRPWEPSTTKELERERLAQSRSVMRREVEEVLATEPYLGQSTAEQVVLRFIADTGDVYPGQKVNGGRVMHWIDQAADVCASRWSGRSVVAVFAGGVRFYTPVRVGDLIEFQARLVHTGRRSMHVSIRVGAGDRRSRSLDLVAHGLTVMVATDEHGRAVPVHQWSPVTEQDRALERRALELNELRGRSQHDWAS